MDDKFYSAVLNQPPLIFGRRLKPFCIGHYAILEAIGSPFILGGEISVGDCLITLQICWRNFSEARLWLWELNEKGGTEDATKLGTEHGTVDMKAVCLLLVDHVKQSLAAMPKTWKKEGARTLKVPLACFLVSNLMRYCRMEENRAWNTPVALADWYIISASGSDDSIVSEGETSQMDLARQLAQELEEQERFAAGARN